MILVYKLYLTLYYCAVAPCVILSIVYKIFSAIFLPASKAFCKSSSQ